MARPKSPCGTYPAYKRHLREKTAVDPACRRAQQLHDAGRGGAARARDVEPVRVLPAPATASARAAVDEARAAYLAAVLGLAALVRVDDLYGVIDLEAEMGSLLVRWCEAADDLDFELGYPNLSEELRARLLASRGAADES